MAFVTGTATDYLDLLNIVVSTATANGWVVVADARVSGEGAVYLRGTGMAGLENIYCNISTAKNVGADNYLWYLNGATGYQGAATFTTQPGTITANYPAIALWNQPMKYWICVNPRRIIVVANVSTVYVACYLGFMLPYSTPTQYPYPLVIGGSQNPGLRWSTVGNGSTLPFIPLHNNPNSVLWPRLPNGSWYPIHMQDSTNNSSFYYNDYKSDGVWPYGGMFETTYSFRNLGLSLSGEYTLQPLIIHYDNFISGSLYHHAALGEFDGVYHVAGRSNASENIVQIGGDDYLVVQNIYRTGLGDYVAVKLV